MSGVLVVCGKCNMVRHITLQSYLHAAHLPRVIIADEILWRVLCLSEALRILHLVSDRPLKQRVHDLVNCGGVGNQAIGDGPRYFRLAVLLAPGALLGSYPACTHSRPLEPRTLAATRMRPALERHWALQLAYHCRQSPPVLLA